MTGAAERLRDVHAPARFIDGEIHWQMACGPQAIDASISATALHMMGPKPFPAYLEAFEQHRPVLCELASHLFSRKARHNKITIDVDDILQLLGQGLLSSNDPTGHQPPSGHHPPD